ncbi:DUF5107 domain-containing protein [Caproiciproducens faecalis]|uniref:DUF5107 domain-containing protein n=1 Tax=Caproiciproducens faecalis TaxID=2820301 RepID=A0ABS7DMV6_9FIRM|nr:DUF5107 domain-containing protein [Caproiciproducens faecalis]MBW7572636.1 DUF5107 domain-containing protein [Caproiciproducens faecalis]
MKIVRSVLNIPGAELESGNPLPRFRDRAQEKPLIDAGLLESEKKGFAYQTGFRELPYTVQDTFHRDLKPRQLKTVVMENDFLRATFLADYGGRLWSLYDKRAERELLFTNPVLRLGNLAIRNAWFSGGIEWNLGQFGHTCLTCEPMFFARCTGKDGEPFLRMYEYERQKCFFLQIDFHLPEDSDRLFAHVKILNTQPHAVPLYWWTNIAVREEKNVRVFSQSDGVVCIKPETMSSQNSAHGFAHDTMPYLKSLNGLDASYPQNLSYSNEYFFQNRHALSDAWETAVYDDGTAFWERSTAALCYRKMFCWGMQRGGCHWKDFLSLDGEGNYLEVQAGLSPSQVHGEDIEPNGCVRFTQVFGGMAVDKSEAFSGWEASKQYVHSRIDQRLSEEELLRADGLYEALEDTVPDEILYCGSGWGALEAARDPQMIPKGLLFPEETLGEKQAPWLALLRTGRMPEPEKERLPASWMTDPRWMALLAKSLQNEENRSAQALLHLGLMLYESGKWQDGINAMKQSIAVRPTAVCCRNLAQALLQDDHLEEACSCMEQALALGGAEQSEVMAQDAIDLFTKAGRYQQAWDCYRALPESLKAVERVRLNTVRAAFELEKWEFLEEQFAFPFAVMREGETMLLDTWFMVQAVRMARQRGTTDWKSLLEEARTTLSPPYNLDFRMTT